MNDDVIGTWRGEQGKTADITLVWGVPTIAGGAVVTAELANLAVDQCELVDERFTLIAPDNYRGDFVNVKLWDRRGNELAVESLYVDDDEAEEDEAEDCGLGPARPAPAAAQASQQPAAPDANARGLRRWRVLDGLGLVAAEALGDPPALQRQHLVGQAGGKTPVTGRDQHAAPKRSEEGFDHCRLLRIQPARRVLGDQQLGAVGERDGQRRSLRSMAVTSCG